MKRLPLLLLAAALLAACTDDPGPTTPSAATGSPSAEASTPAAEPTVPAVTATAPTASGLTGGAVPPFPANTAADTEQPSGEPMTVVGVRAARQQGYDRVVFELRGKQGVPAGRPGWRVEYVDRAVQDGSGDEVEVAGSTTLSVFVEGVALPFETGQTEASKDLTPRDTRFVREVDLQATFEGRFTAFVGLDRTLPFRVFRLADPARVVVDVRHS